MRSRLLLCGPLRISRRPCVETDFTAEIAEDRRGPQRSPTIAGVRRDAGGSMPAPTTTTVTVNSLAFCLLLLLVTSAFAQTSAPSDVHVKLSLEIGRASCRERM